jgi:hypothetical protein
MEKQGAEMKHIMVKAFFGHYNQLHVLLKGGEATGPLTCVQQLFFLLKIQH